MAEVQEELTSFSISASIQGRVATALLAKAVVYHRAGKNCINDLHINLLGVGSRKKTDR